MWIIIIIFLLKSRSFCDEHQKIIISPTAMAERIALLTINKPQNNAISFAIITKKDDTPVRTLEIKQEEGTFFVEWDGLDINYNLMPSGEYYLCLCTNIYWELDKSFGLDGRIGSFEIKHTIQDPHLPIQLPEGEVYSVHINGIKYNQTTDETLGGNYYQIIGRKLVFKSSVQISKGDEVVIKYYFPCYLENPWQVETDNSESLYILTLATNQSCAYIVKLSKDGKNVETNFAASGTIKLSKTHQFALDENNNLLFTAGATSTGHGIGAISLKTGAPLYSIASKNPSIRHFGLCLTGSNLIHSFDGYTFDRTKESSNTYLYYDKQGNLWSKLPPLVDTYWGPCMSAVQSQDTFFVSDYRCIITKCKVLEDQLVRLYYNQCNFAPLGLAYNDKLFLLFAAIRTKKEKNVAIFIDTGKALKYLMSLADNELGPPHSVFFINGYLYVVEDALTPHGRIASQPVELTGKNRISRYKIFADRTEKIAIIEIK